MITDHELSLMDAAQYFAAENKGTEVALPDAVDAVATMAGVGSDEAKAAVFWLIDRELAHLTETFMVAFGS